MPVCPPGMSPYSNTCVTWEVAMPSPQKRSRQMRGLRARRCHRGRHCWRRSGEREGRQSAVYRFVQAAGGVLDRGS